MREKLNFLHEFGWDGVYCIMQWVDVATYTCWDKARELLAYLEEEGFHVKIQDEARFQRFWFLSEPIASLHVEVAKGEEVAVRKWIDRWESWYGPLRGAIHCPECNSTRVEFPQFTRKFIIISILPILLARVFHLQRFYCEECHHTWRKK